jgi:DNA-binding LacI/PurR family transcriptional regulator
MDTPARGPARLALAGDRSPHARAHQRIPGLLEALAGEGLPLDACWIPTADQAAAGSAVAAATTPPS